MTKKRREAILASLRAGNWIYMVWTGSDRNGRLRYNLDGVPRLSEAEVEELKREGWIVAMKRGETSPGGAPYLHFQWKPYRLKTMAEVI